MQLTRNQLNALSKAEIEDMLKAGIFSIIFVDEATYRVDPWGEYGSYECHKIDPHKVDLMIDSDDPECGWWEALLDEAPSTVENSVLFDSEEDAEAYAEAMNESENRRFVPEEQAPARPSA